MNVEPHDDARFPTKADAPSHFAWIRTRLSVERTLMAWIRTATALIGFGFTIVQFFERLENTAGVEAARRPDAPRYLGLALIGAGVAGLLISIHQYRRLNHYLLAAFPSISGLPDVAKRTPLVYIAVALVLIGLFAFVAVLTRVV
ncbi:MAG: DUF202 domain-containing protein [Proteobacteria bacterium]|nr:DUF202 domain-containing protein [Pseudomonadota bacterium]